MRGDLQTGCGGADHQLAQLGRCRSPGSTARARGDPLGAAVDEDLDGAGPHQRAAETCANTQARGGLEQLPREKLVDPHTQPTGGGELLIRAHVIREATIDGRAYRRDASRKEELLSQEDPCLAVLQAWRRLDVRNQAHRRLQQQAVGGAVRVAVDPAAMWVLRLGRDARRREGRGVCDARVPSALVDESRPPAGCAIQVAPVWLPALGQLVRPITHALQPSAGLERPAMRFQTLRDLTDASCATQVGAESRQPEIDDMSVRVVEAS